MKKIKVLLIDYDINVVNSFKKYFSNHEKIEVYKYSIDGEEALDIILNKDHDYQVVILDLVLPSIDGVTLIKKICKSKTVIVNTSYISNKIFSKIASLEIDRIIIKPAELEVIEEIILDLMCINKSEKKMENTISSLLLELGVPSHLKGYLYLKESINKVYNDSTFSNVTLNLYPYLSSCFSTTSECIEKNIRNAIEISWNRGNFETMEKIFGYSVCQEKGKPTNLQYIMTIVENLKLNN